MKLEEHQRASRPVMLRMPRDLYNTMAALTRERDVKISEIIVAALRAYLKQPAPATLIGKEQK